MCLVSDLASCSRRLALVTLLLVAGAAEAKPGAAEAKPVEAEAKPVVAEAKTVVAESKPVVAERFRSRAPEVQHLLHNHKPVEGVQRRVRR